jgi:hypothetical protein
MSRDAAAASADALAAARAAFLAAAAQHFDAAVEAPLVRRARRLQELEAKRAAKAGLSLDKWLAQKAREAERAAAEAAPTAVPTARPVTPAAAAPQPPPPQFEQPEL